MNTQLLIKSAIILGGGLLMFFAIKPALISDKKQSKSFSSSLPEKYQPTQEELDNAEIAAMAYSSAIMAGEMPSKLSELNSELMKEFGLRCYLNRKDKITVCNSKGNIILEK